MVPFCIDGFGQLVPCSALDLRHLTPYIELSYMLCCHSHGIAASLGPGSSTDTVMVLCRTWQAIERLLRTDAVLLGRRLITCGAHAAAEELCARRQMPADFVIEVTPHMHLPPAMQHPTDQLASSKCCCGCAQQTLVQTASCKHISTCKS